MIPRHAWPLIPLLAAVLLAACASAPPTVYYTLLAAPQNSVAPVATAGFAIEVLPVGIPSQLDVPQLVVRRSAGELALVESRHWAAPLHRELRAALSEQLSAALGVADVQGLGAGDQQQVVRIKINFSRFEAWPGQQTVVAAGWSLSQAATEGLPARTLTCSTQMSQAVGASYEDLIAGYQRAVQALAAEIAAGVRVLRKTGVGGCAGGVAG